MERSAATWLVVALAGALCCSCSGSAERLDRQDRENPLLVAATAKRDEGDVASAIRLYETALEKQPGLARAHLDLAILLHDCEKDYVGAIYHYRRYLKLRPATQKRQMIENRIRLAGQMFGAAVPGSRRGDRDRTDTASHIAELERENAALRDEIKKLNEEVEMLKNGMKTADR